MWLSGSWGHCPSFLLSLAPPLRGPYYPFVLPVLYLRSLGTDPEETILHAFKVFDTEGKGFVKADL